VSFTISAIPTTGPALSFWRGTAQAALEKMAELSEAGSSVNVMTNLGTKVSSEELAAIAKREANADRT